MTKKRCAADPSRPKAKKRPENRLAVIFLIISLSGLTVLFFLWRYPLNKTPGYNLKGEAERFASRSLLLTDRQLTPLAHLEANRKAAPASLTKMMTVLVALEECQDLSATTQIDTDSYLRMVESNASMAGFYGRETVTIRDLVYGTMLPSGGEAASSLAIAIAGDEASFVRLMNNKVAELGLQQTHFTNVTGLDDPDQYSTAADLARLLTFALDNPDFRAVFTAATYQSSPSLDHPDGVYMESSVLHAEQEYGLLPAGTHLVGGKSGITDAAGRCWASLLEKDGREYLAVTLGANLELADPPAQLTDTAKLAELIP